MASASLESLRVERDRFVAFSFAAADLLIEVDGTGAVRYAAGAAQRLCGCPAESLEGRSVYDLVAAEDRALCRTLVRSIERGGVLKPVAVRLAKAEFPYVVLGGCTLPERSRSVYLTLAVAVALQQADAAGGALLARDAFIETALRRMQVEDGAPWNLSLVALEGVAALRERLAEEVGEGLRAALGRQLQSAAPEIEAAGEMGEGRYGLLHRGALDTQELKRNIEGFAKALDPTGVGVALEAATLALDRAGLNEGDATRALVHIINEFAAQADGGLTVTSLRGGLDALAAATAARIAQLRSTVDAGAFAVAFQPVVDLATRKVHHLEALARFPADASTGGMVAFAEAVGMIAEFDLAMCCRALALLAEARPGQVPIAVNLSGRSLESHVFAGELVQLLDFSGVRPAMLLFEITETAAMLQVRHVNGLVQSLRRRGFRFCLDDFGAGANAFHYLRAFEVDFVKIDGPFGQDALAQPRDRSLLRSIVEFCREVGVPVVAEMVETEAQAAGFQKLGVAYGQGFLFARPSADPDQFAVRAKRFMRPRRKAFTATST
jgi:EAL domain-containing protein (putative c-di-GMP-specific phosphodiesterase class I)